jgi:TonB family protein
MITPSKTLRPLLWSCLALFVISPEWHVRAADRAVAKSRIVYGPRPVIPEIARAHHLRGAGVFLCRVRQEDGSVTKVTVVQSTGHGILDSATVAALSKWRFQPHTVTTVRIPMTYSGNYHE